MMKQEHVEDLELAKDYLDKAMREIQYAFPTECRPSRFDKVNVHQASLFTHAAYEIMVRVKAGQ